MKDYPINEVREKFPALHRTYHDKKVVYLDGPGGSQIIQGVIDSISEYMTNGNANLSGQFATSKETEEMISDTRKLIADFLDVSPKEVTFGQNATSLAFTISRAIARDWNEDDEIVVTELDHPANIDSWLKAGEDKDVKIRWLKVDENTLDLDLSKIEKVINEKTSLVAITLASNAIGTVPKVDKIAARAKEVGAILCVDAVHAIPHFSIRDFKFQPDIILCSAYKFFGPHIGFAAIKEPLFESLEAYKVNPSPQHIPDKLETGTQNFSAIKAIKPAIGFIEEFGSGDSRKERIRTGYKKVEQYENFLANRIREQLSKISQVKIFESATENADKTPTIAFTLANISPKNFSRIMAEEYSIFVADGHFYATRLANRLGVLKDGGWIRVGIAPYNTVEEVDYFIESTKKIVNSLD